MRIHNTRKNKGTSGGKWRWKGKTGDEPLNFILLVVMHQQRPESDQELFFPSRSEAGFAVTQRPLYTPCLPLGQDSNGSSTATAYDTENGSLVGWNVLDFR